MAERIDIEINDKVQVSVRKKILGIADAARRADNAVDKLKKNLASIDGSALNKLTNANQKLAISNQKVAIETSKAAIAETNSKIALQKLNVETSKASLLNERLQGQLKQTSLQQQRFLTEVKRTDIAHENLRKTTSNATAAQTRAEHAALRLKTAQDKLAKSTKNSYVGFKSLVGQLIAFAGVSLGAGAIIRVADAYTNLQNKLKNVVSSEAQLAEISERVFEIAKRTRSSVDDTAQAFQRFDLALQQLGASQEESLQLTESVNKSLVLSGATTNEQASALLQLSQAFNKGKLDGDEFRTVMELMPNVADAIAKQLNVTRGELLKLAPQGKITAEVMQKAFANAREEIDKRFSKTIPTISQALVVAKNSAVKFFGELDKRLGITKKVASAILVLSDNMHLVTTAALTLGAALIVAFGPTLLGTLSTASAALKGFAASLASNPIGLIVIGLTAATALFVAFKDEIALSSDGVVTLGNAFTATYQLIVEGLQPVVSFWSEVWDSAFSKTEKKTSSFVDFLSKALKMTASVVKTVANFYVRVYVAAFNSITRLWAAFPRTFGDIVTIASNSVINTVEKTVNAVLKGLNELLKLANKASEFLGFGSIFKTDLSVDLSSFKGDVEAVGFNIGKIIKEEVTSAFNTDFIGLGLDAIGRRARKIGTVGDKKSSLRGKGKSKTPPDVSKDALKRANALAKLNRELQSELRLLQFIGPELEVQQRFEQINNQLLAKKIVLTNKEKGLLTDTLRLLQSEKQIHGELSSIYEENIGSQTQLSNRLEATSRAYDLGIIKSQQYASRLAELNIEASQLKITMNDASFTDVFIASIGNLTSEFENALTGMTQSFSNFTTTFVNGFADSVGQALVYWEDFDKMIGQLTRSALKELISQLVKVGVQWVATETLKRTQTVATQSTIQASTIATAATQQATLASTNASSTAAASQTASAWAPAAATTSIASFGGAATIGVAALLGALALFKNKGFKEGGYTGNVGVNQTAGVVHGQEFVVNAPATAANRDTLEAMNRGAKVVSTNSRNVGTAQANVNMKVVVENYGSSEIEVEQMSANEVRVIARDEVKRFAPETIASDIGNPNGRTSKALTQYTNTTRRR